VKNSAESKKMSRRDFLKLGALIGLGAQIATLPIPAFQAGSSKETYTGWESFEGEETTQYFDRKPFEISVEELYTRLHPVKREQFERADKYSGMAFNRVIQLTPIFIMSAIEAGLIQAPPPEAMASPSIPIIPLQELTDDKVKALKDIVYPRLPDDYFRKHYDDWMAKGQDRLFEDIRTVLVIAPRLKVDQAKYSTYLALFRAYTNCVQEHDYSYWEPNGPAEVSDYTCRISFVPGLPVSMVDIKAVVPATGTPERLEFKSPAHASKLIKKIAHQLGATLVRISKFNPDYVYSRGLRGSKPGYGYAPPPTPPAEASSETTAGLTGSAPPPDSAAPPAPGTFSPFFLNCDTQEFEVPAHWKYVIVLAIPNEWDQYFAAPNYGDTFDAYTRMQMAAGRLSLYLKHLGYAGRPQLPGFLYDIMVTPFAIQSGLGQWGRQANVITPELGANQRLGAVITDLELEPDLPIDFGVADFCKNCRICAEACPTQAISYAASPEEQEDNGYDRGYQKWYINTSRCMGSWDMALGEGCRLCAAVCPYTRKDNWVHGIARTLDPIDPTGLVSSSFIWMQRNFFDRPATSDFLPPPDGCYAAYRPKPEWLTTADYLTNPHEDPQALCKK